MFDVKTYVVHCKKLISRKLFMGYQLSQQGFSNVEFYEDYDGDELTPEIVNKYQDSSFEKQIKKCELWFPGTTPRVNKPSDISVTIKYIEIYKKIANGKDDFAIIFEDDSVLDPRFIPKFHSLYEETPGTYDMIFMASGCNLKSTNIVSGKNVYRKDHPATRCVGASVVKKQTCIKLLETIIPFSLCIDWELNYHLYLHNHEVYWWEPPIVNQGSETGIFKTSMR